MTNFKKTAINYSALLLILLGAASVSIQAQQSTTTGTEKSTKPLNLDDQSITEDLAKEVPVAKKTEAVSVEPNKMNAEFSKAEKHGVVPTITEINTAGTPQRVTKVTGKDGSYCVYSPTVARTDGIDEIQNGLQNQVRSCPP